MADKDLEVEIGADVSETDPGFKAILDNLRQVNEAALKVQETFRGSARSLAPLVKQISDLGVAFTKASTEADKLRILQEKARAQSEYVAASAEVNYNRRQLQADALDQARARQSIANSPTGDGRTIGQAQLTNAAINGQITAIETQAENLVARMADAISKALERQARTTPEAMAVRPLAAQTRQSVQNTQFGVEGYADSTVTQAKIAAQRRVEAMAGITSLADLNARTQAQIVQDQIRREAEYENRQRALAANRIRREAERENLERDGLARRGALQVRSEAEYEDRQRRLQLAMVRREAEAENRQRDNIAKRAANQTRADAEYENRQRDKAAREASKPTIQDRVANAGEYRDAMLNANGGADFLSFQARLIANYTILGTVVSAVKSSISSIVQFDDVLGRFQAVTGTANAEMGKFRSGLLEVAATSRFAVTDLAQVAITLAQTGLSAKDTLAVLPAVSNLAAASGSSLQQAVEAVTTVMGAYSVQAGRAGDISDVLVGALNRTKLTIEQLQLGLGYSANVAREAGVSFSELTAVIGGIAQAGVRSGSTLGTGTRQLIQELTAPSEKLKTVMKDLGISFADIDLKANGLTGVLDNLRQKGFSTSDALRSLDLRAASAFAALVGQSDKVKQLQVELLLSNAAAEAAAKANDTLTGSLTRFSNQLFAVSDRAFTPFVGALKVGTDGVSSLFSGLQALGPILPVIGTGIATVAAAMAGLKIAGLLAGLAGAGGLATAIGSLSLLGPIGVGIGATAATIAAALSMMSTKAQDAAVKLDKLKASANDLTSRQGDLETTTRNIDQQIGSLLDRREKLNSDPILRRTAIIEAQKAFGDLGLDISSTSGTIEGLIDALQRLRGKMQERLPELFTSQLANLQEQFKLLREQADRGAKNPIGDGPLELSRSYTTSRLGDQFGSVYDVLKDPKLLDQNDPSKTAGPLFALLNGKAAEVSSRLSGLQLKSDLGSLTNSEKRDFSDLREQSSILDTLNKRLGSTVKIINDLQANNMAQERTRVSSAASAIQASPEMQAFDARVKTLTGSSNSQARAILNDNSLSGTEKSTALVRSNREIRENAGTMADEVDRYRTRLEEMGVSKAVIDEALSKILDSLSGLNKTVTKEMEEIASSINKDATFELQAERRTNESQIKALLKKSQLSRDQNEVDTVIPAQIAAAMARRREIEEALIKLQLTNPDDLAKRPELKEALAQRNLEIDTQLEQYQEQLLAASKRLAEQILSRKGESLEANRQRVEADISALKKQLAAPSTTPEKAKQLGDAINALIDEARRIVIEQKKNINDREAINAPKGPLAGYTPTTTITNSNLSPEARAFMAAVASVESGGRYNVRYGTNVPITDFSDHPTNIDGKFFPSGKDVSSAAGKFQITSSTWNEFADKGMAFTPENQEIVAWRIATKRYKESTGADLQADLKAKGFTPDMADSLNKTWTGFRGGKMKAVDEYKRAFGTTTSTDVRASKEEDETTKAKVDAEKRKEETDREVADVKRREALRALAVGDKSVASELALQESLVRRAKSVDEATSASAKVIGTIATQRDRALQRDDTEKSGLSRTPQGRDEDREIITQKYAAAAVAQAVAGADAVGKQSLKVFQDRVETLKAELEVLENPLNANKTSQAEIDQKKTKLRAAEEELQVEGQYKAVRDQILEIERALKQLQDAGLGDSKSILDLEVQKTSLLEKQARLKPQVDLKTRIANEPASYGKAAEGGTVDFLKSRGIVQPLGGLVKDTEVARKALNESLGAVASGFDTLFLGLATKSKSAKELFRDFATSILQNLASLASKAVTNELFKMLFGSGGTPDPKSGDSSTGLLGSFVSMISGAFGGKSLGGEIRMAGGGAVPDTGLPTRDSVPILAMPGEVMMRKSAVDVIGRDKLLAMNAMGNTIMNDNTQKMQAPNLRGGDAQATANVYVVAPDQKPVPGPNDIVHAIADDIQRRGAIRTLIKQVQAG